MLLGFKLQGRYSAQEMGCGRNRYPEGAQPPAVILEAACYSPETTIRTFVAAAPAETFAAFALRVAAEAGTGPHTAHVSAEDAARNVAPRRQAPLTALAALTEAGYTVEVTS